MYSLPDGALPHSPRWSKDDPYRTTRHSAGIGPFERRMLDEQRARIVEELHELDDESIRWMKRRRFALYGALHVHERLWPSCPAGRARRPPRPDQAPMPPVDIDARPLRGINLRVVALGLLQQHRQLTLREMHALLHLSGYVIASPTPVKALADALGYEVTTRRATRVRRATYRAVDPHPIDVGDPILRESPDDWYPALAAALRGESFAGERNGLRVVHGRCRHDTAIDTGEEGLSVAADAFGVGPVEGKTDEEFGGHTPTLAGVVASTTGTCAGRLGLAQRPEQRAVLPDVGKAPDVSNRSGPELVVDHEGAGVYVADRVDETHDATGATQVEAGQRLAQGVQVEERVAGENGFAVGQEPPVDLSLLIGGRVQGVPRFCPTTRWPEPGYT